jgi:hypothetical protein
LLRAPLRAAPLYIIRRSFIYIEQRRSISNSSGRHYVAHTAHTFTKSTTHRPRSGLYIRVCVCIILARTHYKEILLTVSLPAARCGHQRSSRQRRRRQENKPPAAPWAKSCVYVSEWMSCIMYCVYGFFVSMHSLGRNECSKINIRARSLGRSENKCSMCTSEIGSMNGLSGNLTLSHRQMS